MQIKEILKYGIEKLKTNNIDEPILKTRLLIAHCIGKNKEYVISNDTENLAEEAEKKIKEWIERLVQNEPIQYVLGYQEFMGLNFKVDKNVLIPRQDTEIIVEEVLNHIRNNEISTVLDMCTGSGAIAVSLKKYVQDIEVDAADISEEAIKIAKNNSIKNDVKVKLVKTDLFNNIKKQYDIIVSNPPYIETETINILSEEVKKEPRIALDGGTDGLDFYRKIILDGYKYLNKNGWIFLEIGYNQKAGLEELVEKSGLYKNFYSKKDLGGNDRLVAFQKK